MKLFISPFFNTEDRGDGGIRRVVEAQRRWLPTMGWEIVDQVEQADIVATHAGMRAEVDALTPVVNHCHGLYWYGYEWPEWALKMNRDVIKAMRRADVVTAPSKWVAHAIARGTNIDAPVLYHGIEPDDWPPTDAGSGYVLWNKTRRDSICDPTPMWRLADMAPDVHFVSTLDWGMQHQGNIEITGVSSLETHRKWIRHAGVYLATTRETFGIGTLEAMASGVPVLGWDWGGQAEIVTHGEDGWLAKPDDYAGLLEGLRYCLAHRQSLGKQAREKVLRDFTWQTAIERYDALYRQLLARPTSPKISVVIPAYNMGSYVVDAIDSVKQQDYSDYEVILVDDASTDKHSMEVIDYIERNTDVRVIRNPTNQYLAEALNTGISAARGRYVLPLDADNMLGEHALKLLSTALDADRDIDIAYGRMSVIEEDGREWISDWPPREFDFRRQMIHQNQISSTCMYRRRAWERVGGYRRRCRTAEDADFWCRATSFGANARHITDAVILRYRNRSSSMSHTVEDWAWHAWYPWGKRTELTPWLAPIDSEKEHPTIPMHEFSMVSVIIPVGPGHERLVLDALDSVRSQTFPWWEAIVVNDSGADLPWCPPWVRVVDTGGKRGAGYARNLGMSVANGDFFIFLDADDYFQPEALEVLVCEQHRAGGFVFSDWYKQESGEVYFAPEWDGCTSVLSQLPWPVTCLYPREAWAAAGGFDVDLPAWEDWDFAIKVVEAGYCGTRVAVPLFHYRIGTGQRRETGFADRENLKLEILKRWSHYIKGEKQMPCGCSGGGGLPSLPALDLYAQTARQASPAPSGEDAVLIEYVGDALAPITYTGPVSGSRYKFGQDDDHRVRWVYIKDVPHFTSREEFRVYANVEAMAPLAAAGPPR